MYFPLLMEGEPFSYTKVVENQRMLYVMICSLDARLRQLERVSAKAVEVEFD